jgi:tRNA threonylcarbamoyl adenosine modification protein (Sua5/YciO/YrdC/YwlC family)
VPILPAAGDPPPEASLLAALEALAEGRIVGIPTDTVYGLAADPFRPGASDRLFEAKRRSRDVDLPVLVASVDQAMSLTTAVPGVAMTLMERFWPGPLTLVLPRRPGLTADLGDDEATIGVRCPDHPVPLALCAKGGPMATTSANLHGQPTSQTAEEVVAVFGDAVPWVLDGGRRAGSPSTVVDCTGTEPRLLREGRIPWEDVVGAVAGRLDR